ncbi:MAG: Carboxymethylenebutenolidase [Acidimicrobiales bacterium]|nr:Carboxymethylenebutenolidase [Acidimicrobiales bacterium]
MDMHVWTPDGAVEPRPAVLLIQEIFGVGSYIRAVAERLAAAGYVVGAPDVFWRFARNWEAAHDEAGLGASFGMVQQLDMPQAIADCATALAHLASLDGVERAPGVLGFCLGGTLAWGVAAEAEPSVCVSYYGSGVPSMIGMIDQIHCPTLLHFGNDDPYLPSEGVEAVSAAVAGKPGFAVNVEIAGHAFDNHEADIFYNEAAANAAWAKTMAFLGLYLPVPSTV